MNQYKDQPNEVMDWLLEPGDPGVRYLAMRDLLELPVADAALTEARRTAHVEGPIAAVLDAMHEDGWWVKPGPGYNPKYRSTVWALILLAQLGARVEDDERIGRAITYVLDHALTTLGQFTSTGAPSGTIDCLQGNLCWALAEMGCQDARLALAYDWLARSVTGEGVASLEAKDARVRYYAYKCGPGFACGVNNSLPCAWGAVKVMRALGSAPETARSRLTEEAVASGAAFLLGTDPASACYPTSSGAKPNSSWWKFGFPVFYVTDVLQIVEAMAALGYGGDARLTPALDLILSKRSANGRWEMEYEYNEKTWVQFGEKRQPNKWVTLRAMRALKASGMFN